MSTWEERQEDIEVTKRQALRGAKASLTLAVGHIDKAIEWMSALVEEAEYLGDTEDRIIPAAEQAGMCRALKALAEQVRRNIK